MKRQKQALDTLTQSHNNEIREIQQAFGQKIEELEAKHRAAIEKLTASHDDQIHELKQDSSKKLEILQAECELKVKKMLEHIKYLQNEDENDALSKAIYNCVTIQEIMLIKRLIEDNKIDELIDKHLAALQSLLFSLSVGVIPICDPQRAKISQ